MKGTHRKEFVIMKKFLLVALLALFGLAVSGCQTAEGFGEDMEDAGEKIQDGVN